MNTRFNDSKIERQIESVCRSQTCEGVKLLLVGVTVALLTVVLFIGVSLMWGVLKVFPVVNFILLFVAIILLAYVEALHYGCVVVEKMDMEQYQDQFPRACKCQKLVDTPEKIKKFLVGRQFLVISVVFLIAQITTFEDAPNELLGMSKLAIMVLIRTGLPGIMLVFTYGQLISQIFAEEFLLQFMNLYGCEFVIHLAMGAEYIGVCNFSWLLYGMTSRLLCKRVRRIQKNIDRWNRAAAGHNSVASPVVTREGVGADDINGTLNSFDTAYNAPPLSPHVANRGAGYDSGIDSKKSPDWFDFMKYTWSTAATAGSLSIVIYGISIKAYVLPVSPVAASVIAAVVLITLFFLEGLMVALAGTQYWDQETFSDVYPRAYHLHQLIARPENMKRFIIGRQYFTICTNFLLAQVFIFPHWPNNGSHDPVLFFIVIKSGLAGIFIILAFAQLLPELLAAEFPLRFMNLFGSFTISYLCLFFDTIGVGHAAWLLYYIMRNTNTACRGQGDPDASSQQAEDRSEVVLRVESAEVLDRVSVNAKKHAQAAAGVGVGVGAVIGNRRGAFQEEGQQQRRTEDYVGDVTL